MKLCLILIFSLFLSSCGDESSGSEKETESSTASVIAESDVTGTITNAQTGAALDAVTVYITGSRSSTETRTDNDGNYTIEDAPSGSQTITASISNFVSEDISLTIAATGTNADNNFSLLPDEFGENRYVITLSWAATPEDIDAHLYVGNNSQTRVYHGATGSLMGGLGAQLDVDDQNGNGPETVRIRMNAGGTGPLKTSNDYRFVVHNYDEDPDFDVSEAVVRVYVDESLEKTYTVPTTGGSGDHYWHVFDLDSSGNFTDENSVGADPGAP